MFRIIRRSPWIAVGALGAWLLDGEQGPQRRAQVTSQAKRLANSLTGATSGRSSFTAAPVDLPDTAPSFDQMTADSLRSTSPDSPSTKPSTKKDAPNEREAIGAAARG